MHTRRHLLVALGATATAGCTGALGSGEDGEGDETSGRVRLEELSVQNDHAAARDVQVAVEADGDVRHLDTYDLAGGGGRRTVDGEWGEAAAYRVHARLDGGDVRTAHLTRGIEADAECVRALLRIDSTGELTVWSGTDCGDDPDGSED
ncbi:hypothetical protein [Natronomonas sp.]|uniref:hypothetical protein n=1 Tax=Natronomonas sp. TaxID=2184060 RepID=UPI00260916C7|nr:hypothetical protein [Natronomonas sp.]